MTYDFIDTETGSMAWSGFDSITVDCMLILDINDLMTTLCQHSAQEMINQLTLNLNLIGAIVGLENLLLFQ